MRKQRKNVKGKKLKNCEPATEAQQANSTATPTVETKGRKWAGPIGIPQGKTSTVTEETEETVT